MRVLTGYGYPIERLSFSPDGRWLVAPSRPGHNKGGRSFDFNSTFLWDLAAGTWDVLPVFNPAVTYVVETGSATDVRFHRGVGAARLIHPVFTPDGRSVLYAGTDDGMQQRLSLRLFDPGTGASAPLAVAGREPADFARPLFTPDGSRLLSLRPLEFGRERGWFLVNCTAFPGWKPAGQWRVDGRFDQMSVGPDTLVAAISPCGKSLATVSALGLVVLDLETGETLHRPEIELKGPVRLLAYHPTGHQLALGVDAKVSVFDSRTWARVAELRQNRKHFLSGAFTPDGRHFLTASNEETVKVWDAASWTKTREYAWQVGGLRSVAVAPDGTAAAVASDQGEIVVFDLDD